MDEHNDTDTRFSNLELDDAPRIEFNECPLCGNELGVNPSCEVCAAHRHAEARRLAHGRAATVPEAVPEPILDDAQSDGVPHAIDPEETERVTTEEVREQVRERLENVRTLRSNIREGLDDLRAGQPNDWHDSNTDSGFVRTVGTLEDELVEIQRERSQLQTHRRYNIQAERVQQAPQDDRMAIAAGNIVAGAAEVSDAKLFGWMGGGEITRARALEMVDEAQLPTDFYPRSKSAHHHAGKAVSSVNHSGVSTRSLSRPSRHHRGWRGVKAKWAVGSVNAVSEEDNRYGNKVGIVTLMENGELTWDPHPEANPGTAEHVGDRILSEYMRTTGAEVMRSTDVSDWLRDTIVLQWNGCRLGGNWYVQNPHADACERLLDIVASEWGSCWMLPAIPVATTQALRVGIARGFARDVEELLAKLEGQRSQYRKRGTDIGPTAAATYLTKLNDIASRARSYADVLGVRGLATVAREARRIIAELEPIASTASVRSANIWQDLVADGEVEPY